MGNQPKIIVMFNWMRLAARLHHFAESTRVGSRTSMWLPGTTHAARVLSTRSHLFEPAMVTRRRVLRVQDVLVSPTCRLLHVTRELRLRVADR
ncbi:hypothetical protein PHMEG_0008899 [Phytophthora megakarya]|uniref:Uncharacterized protein n=1 Tax=Phytophthora megakarya TaxID=4795 RepID=A0A225WHG9_9STRA|nr:hypothetical protein PHMEG_0008899 [Phytophthora megakarya]